MEIRCLTDYTMKNLLQLFHSNVWLYRIKIAKFGMMASCCLCVDLFLTSAVVHTLTSRSDVHLLGRYLRLTSVSASGGLVSNGTYAFHVQV